MSPRADKRQAILDAALRLFAHKGFHGTSVPDLASEAGVGAGTIYRYFDSKETLVNELYRKWKLQISQDVYLTLPTEGTWRSRFRELWQRLFAFDKAHPGVIDFLDLHHHGDYLDEESKLIELQSLTALAALAQQLQDEEVIVDLPAPLVIGMTYSAFLGALRAHRQGYLELDEQTVDLVEQRLWAMLRR